MRTVTVDEGHYETQMIEVPCAAATDCCSEVRGRLRARRCAADACDPRAGACGDCPTACAADCGAGDGCGAPQTTTVCKKVWVPNVVTKEVPVTVCKQVVEEQPCVYTVMVCKPVTRTCKVRVCNYETQTRTRMVKVCDWTTEMRTRTYQTCRMVPEQRTKEVQYTVCVPKKEVRTRTVTVCKVVPEQKEVTYTVCVPRQVQKEVDVCVCKMVQKTVTVPACGDAGCAKTRRCSLLGQRRACKTACATPCEPAAVAACCE